LLIIVSGAPTVMLRAAVNERVAEPMFAFVDAHAANLSRSHE
jgi:hypothetical protein